MRSACAIAQVKPGQSTAEDQVLSLIKLHKTQVAETLAISGDRSVRSHRELR